jgi:5-methylcytosine-specific restriction endonuclease McrA
MSGSNAGTPYGGPWRRIRPAILRRDNYTCQLRLPGCTTRATDVDHIVETSKGGAWHDPANLQAACKRCNTLKSTGQAPPPPPSRAW